MIELLPHAEGTLLPVRAQPGARRDALTGEHAGALRVAVTAPPDRGRANEAIAEVIAESLGLRESQVVLISGATSRQKRFLLRGVDPEAARALLDRVSAS